MEKCLTSSPPSSFCEDSSIDDNPWFTLSDNIASFARTTIGTIHRSALGIMVEFSEMEREAQREMNKFSKGSENSNDELESSISSPPLPWEMRLENSCREGNISTNLKVESHQMAISTPYKDDEVLKDKIFSLSLNESTFVSPFGDLSEDECRDSPTFNFSLDDSTVKLVCRLLQQDQNLGLIHAKLSGRTGLKETMFWKNYFYHYRKVCEDHKLELNGKKLRKTSFDYELDAELVEFPTASYPSSYTNKVSLHMLTPDSETPACVKSPLTPSPPPTPSAQQTPPILPTPEVPQIFKRSNSFSSVDSFVMINDEA